MGSEGCGVDTSGSQLGGGSTDRSEWEFLRAVGMGGGGCGPGCGHRGLGTQCVDISKN